MALTLFHTVNVKASTTMEAVVSVAIISALMVIVFPFFGQVLHSHHDMEIIRGMHSLQEMKNDPEFDIYGETIQEFSESGITVRTRSEQDKEFPGLYHVTTEFIHPDQKVIYSVTELIYRTE